MCGQSVTDQVHRIPSGFMDWDLYVKIVDDLSNFPRINNAEGKIVSPTGIGESLLHPKFSEMLEYIFEKNNENKIFTEFTMNTNATFMDENITNMILKCASMKNQVFNSFQYIILSIDAFSKKTYDNIRRGGDFDKVIKNIKYFINKRKQLGLRFPNLIYQIIVRYENYFEIYDFIKFWSQVMEENEIPYIISNFWPWPTKGCDAIFLRTLVDWFEPIKAIELKESVIKDLEKKGIKWGLQKSFSKNIDIEPYAYKKIPLEFKNKYSEDILKKIQKNELIKNPVCNFLFQAPSFRWDGEVTVCCNDTQYLMSVGNIKNHTFPLVPKLQLGNVIVEKLQLWFNIWRQEMQELPPPLALSRRLATKIKTNA